MRIDTANSIGDFYPRSPCGERPEKALRCAGTPAISIHALLAESDAPSRRLCRRSRNFYPRSPCGERRWLRCWQLAARDISIHALLAESDREREPALSQSSAFLSTLSLRRATHAYQLVLWVLRFLSTLSLRRATGSTQRTYQQDAFLSTLSLRRATNSCTQAVPKKSISIHALLAESDGGGRLSCFVKITFLSTLSLRRATSKV